MLQYRRARRTCPTCHTTLQHRSPYTDYHATVPRWRSAHAWSWRYLESLRSVVAASYIMHNAASKGSLCAACATLPPLARVSVTTLHSAADSMPFQLTHALKLVDSSILDDEASACSHEAAPRPSCLPNLTGPAAPDCCAVRCRVSTRLVSESCSCCPVPAHKALPVISRCSPMAVHLTM